MTKKVSKSQTPSPPGHPTEGRPGGPLSPDRRSPSIPSSCSHGAERALLPRPSHQIRGSPHGSLAPGRAVRACPALTFWGGAPSSPPLLASLVAARAGAQVPRPSTPDRGPRLATQRCHLHGDLLRPGPPSRLPLQPGPRPATHSPSPRRHLLPSPTPATGAQGQTLNPPHTCSAHSFPAPGSGTCPSGRPGQTRLFWALLFLSRPALNPPAAVQDPL